LPFFIIFYIPDRDTAYSARCIDEKGNEPYVRAKFFFSGGEVAFCQPVFIKN
jgi:hypothetical protein